MTPAEGRALLEKAGFTRLAADYIPKGYEVDEGWRIHDFPENSQAAHCICDGLDEGEAALIVAAVNAFPAYLASMERVARLTEEKAALMDALAEAVVICARRSPGGVADLHATLTKRTPEA